MMSLYTSLQSCSEALLSLFDINVIGSGMGLRNLTSGEHFTENRERFSIGLMI